MGAKASEETVVEMAAEDNEIGVNVLGNLADYFGGFAGNDVNFGGGLGVHYGLFELSLHPMGDFDPPSGVNVLGSACAIIGAGVDDVEYRAELFGDAVTGGDQLSGAGVEIDGDDDGFDVFSFVDRGFYVGSGEDRDVGVIQNTSGDGAQEEAAEGAVAVGGDHDEIGLFLVGGADDFAGGFAFAENRFDFAALQIDVDELFKLGFQHRSMLGVPIEDGGGGNVDAFGGQLEGAHDVERDDGCAVLFGEDAGVRGGGGGAGGKIDRQDDGFRGNHNNLQVTTSNFTVYLMGLRFNGFME